MLLMMPLQTAATMPIEIGIALIALFGATLTAYIGTVAFFGFRLGRVPTRQEYTELRNELKADNERIRQEVKEGMVQLRTEFREDNARLREEFREDNARLREEFRTEMAELHKEFRRSHQQLMLALVNHSHRDDGQAVFTAPPELEITPSPADN